MKRTLTVALVALAVAAMLIPAVAQAAKPAPSAAQFFGWAPEAQLQWAGTPRDVQERSVKMQNLQHELMVGQVPAAIDRQVVVELNAAERQRIDRPSRSQGKYLVGIDRALGLDVQFGSSAANRIVGEMKAGAVDVGAVQRSQDGLTWSFAVRVPGATALRLHLTGVDLPRGAALYVYNDATKQAQAFGPYTAKGPNRNGDLFTHTVFGDQIFLQLVQPQASARVPSFRVASVGVMGQRFLLPRYTPQGTLDIKNAVVGAASSLCSFNADCIVNADCQTNNAVSDAKQAVASILFQSGGGYYICTGGLISHNGDSNVIPYFLTAHHCINKGSEASSVETYFDYTTTCNSPNCTQPYNNTGDTVGSTILATGSSSDYSLLQLSSTPTTADGVTAYLGWSATDISSSSTHLYRISHPQGAPQAYSEQTVSTSAGTCRTLPRGSFIYSRDTVGGTEGGSSGSPVVNGSGQIVGQLYGACGTNLNDVCDSANNATVDGAFAASFPNLSQWLDPQGGGGGGGGGGGSCSPKGASCSSNSDCCSGRCRGGHNKSCK